ncbi:DUF1269 domain-containing family protein [Vibrio mediterranei]|uniref:DUF1269 domain-containing family protein n=2 Tax=Vibrio mediterranei TaxID=689 RepID=A0AAN1FJ62_9VIBR|nr:DUF1269 domain-containing family protein [Vibrio mediterranei]
MNNSNVVAIAHTHLDAKHIVTTLVDQGFPIESIFIIGKGYEMEEHATGFYDTDDRVKNWGKTGALWGGIWGALVGSGLFWLPGIGAVVAAGPIVAAVAGAVEGATITGGVTAIGGALASIGIPKDTIVKYETAIKTDKYLVVFDGESEQLKKARNFVQNHKGSTL